jgi:hypothetical protein
MPRGGFARFTEEPALPLKDACEQFERQYVMLVLGGASEKIGSAR